MGSANRAIHTGLPHLLALGPCPPAASLPPPGVQLRVQRLQRPQPVDRQQHAAVARVGRLAGGVVQLSGRAGSTWRYGTAGQA